MKKGKLAFKQMNNHDQRAFIDKLQMSMKKLKAMESSNKRLFYPVKQAKLNAQQEQLRQLYDEATVNDIQKSELKRLEWLDKRANHSYGLKKKSKQARSGSLTRSGSRKRAFVQEGHYIDWTNCYSRKAVQWDEERERLNFQN